MRVVALEEHFTVPAITKRIDPGAVSSRGFMARKPPAGRPNPMEMLEFLSRWFKDHVGLTDRMMGAHLRNYDRLHAAAAS